MRARLQQINDQHGYLTGDAVFTEVAKRIRRAVRADDFVARHAGDEFIMLLTGLQPQHVATLAWSLSKISRHFWFGC